MHTKDYVEAAYATLVKQGDTSKTIASVQAYLKKRGLLKLFPAILRGLIEKTRRGMTTDMPVVTVARAQDLQRHKTEIEAALKQIKGGVKEEIRIDETMIGGFVVKNKDTRIDRSFKNTLLNAYHRLTDRV